MKKAAKVFIIMGMINQFYLVYPIIFGVFALRALKEVKTRKEMKLHGVLTCLLTSAIGGMFMLCLEDEDLASNANKKVEVIKENSNDLIQKEDLTVAEVDPDNSLKTKFKKRRTSSQKFCFVGFIITAVLLMLHYLFSYELLLNYYHGETYIPFLCAIALTPFLIISFVKFLKNGWKFNKTCYVSTFIFLNFAVVSIVLSILTWSNFVYEVYIDYYYGYSYIIDCVAWEPWVTFGLSVGMLVLNAIMLIVEGCSRDKKSNRKIENTNTFDQKNEPAMLDAHMQQKLTDDEVEEKLLRINKLAEIGAISEDERTKLRNIITSQYLKD